MKKRLRSFATLGIVALLLAVIALSPVLADEVDDLKVKQSDIQNDQEKTQDQLTKSMRQYKSLMNRLWNIAWRSTG